MNVVRKHLKICFLLSTTVLSTTAPAWAQSSRRLLKTANKYYENENYRAAIPFFEQALSKDPDNAKALFRAGVSYLAYDKEKSSDYIYKAQRLKPNVSNEVEYWLGRVDHINYRFDEAIAHYKLYRAKLKNKDDYQKDEANLLIKQSENAKTMFANPKDIFVQNLGPTVNTAYSEHSPVISKDGKTLIFTTRSHSGKGEAADGEYFEDIVESTRGANGNWKKPSSLSGRLNSQGHDAAIQLFDNDTKLLLYRQDENGDFFVSEKTNGEWGQPKRLGSNINTRDYESDAYITPDGKTMYFATNHYSEDGDKEIYVSKRTPKGEWGKPRNMGRTINTPFDEDSPFLTPNGKTMYFTSRGHNTMGGYDVFVTRYDSVGRKWTKPENMGYPVNTPDDDAYYRLSADGSVAYLSSYRMNGYGEKDIWMINYNRNVLVRGKVRRQNGQELLPGLELIFRSLPGATPPVELRETTKRDSADFAVELLSGRKYQLTVLKEGRVIATQELDVPVSTGNNKVQLTDILVPDTTTVQLAAAIKPTMAAESTTVIQLAKPSFPKIYFPSNQYTLNPESERELESVAQILLANPDLNLSIGGHTDGQGANEYNQALGSKRARATYDYLLQKGIAAHRLSKISYGENRPAVPNDNLENQPRNRRVEFTMVSKVSQKNIPPKANRPAGRMTAVKK
ncbi:MAG: 18K peptidoglycan-associated outer membrane lipoprotein; Peptidoglycan-associated lipoprotein precursor; Outer membrane protein P6; OmpA/MotB precursor [uncultured Adhaeribacter sp.]|uniref:18K peptidoglycan-associated outer membrane lipoprotein Peptidoglycan-associated lipoprotein Outer membrane protein P6 OmpA/MotB n=1 Tax=uncultured Adhaeribacter sp. TaxID=448109 RepID=A0A6J4HY43_9BACT|nr:MAG: 18K peptidoglycan-associated outer membrane lipoprotein; Peptidoglycan-associated lipoprotein precursor; Outer membrane protein P6; OmpA/MotB precursor [uncultured Adhaeribacter sp.]